jgi:hypothetical protein
MIKLAVVTAFVALLKVLAETYLPTFPISAELINTVILALLSALGVSVVEVAAKGFVGDLKNRGLW